VRNRFLFALNLLLAVSIMLPTLVQAQQPGAQRLPSAETPVARAATPRATHQPAMDPSGVEQDIAEALSVIQDNYVDGKKLDYNAVFKASISSMLHTLDPHSSYFDPKELEEFRTEQRSEYIGIGATLGDLNDGKGVDTTIVATFKDAPASRAGLRFGDRIMEVNGESMRGKHYWETREHLLGQRGTVVKVSVERAATGRVETVEITRDAVPQPSIPEAYMLKPGIGYIAMTGGFNTTTYNELQLALEKLHAEGMNMLVLDLRNNPGGLVIQAVRSANAFLRRGQVIVTQKGRIRDSSMTYVADNDRPDQTPLVVMVNRFTASAAEILAGALQDHDRALIVGETSFGKGLVQLPFSLPSDSALMLTIAKYYTPSGRLIQRDYSNSGFYDYYTNGGSYRSDKQNEQAKPTGPERRTDTGRAVYGGGGITPDEPVKPRLYTPPQQRLADSVFAFSRELALGHIEGFDAYKVLRPIEYGHVLKETDFPITDDIYKALRSFVTSKTAYKVSGAQLDRERAFVERQLRFNLTSAAYGTTTAYQVYNTDDPQIARSIEMLPRARELAQAARLTRKPS
jgi:carboxyl-terminal processing protease